MHVPTTAKGGQVQKSAEIDQISFNMENTRKMHHTIVPAGVVPVNTDG